MSRDPVLYVVSRFPTVTETFVVNEWLRLAGRFPMALAPLVRSRERPIHPEAAKAMRSVRFTPSLAPATVVANARLFLRSPRCYLRTLVELARGSRPTPMGGLAKGLVAFWKAAAIGTRAERSRVGHVHAHFASHAATAAWAAHRLTGIPFSFTAHANDLFAGPALLEQKLRAASFVAVISEYNRAFLAREAPGLGRVELVRCGVDLERFGFRERASLERLLCVARLTETKGQSDLLHAFGDVVAEHPALTLTLVGDGPDRRELEGLVRSLGLSERVEFTGALTLADVREAIEAHDVFTLAARPHPSGRMDGIPVALMEAMASGLPVVTTALSGIPELVVDHETGLLAPPADPPAMARVLRQLLTDPPLARKLARQAREHVARDFNLEVESSRLGDLVEESLTGAAAATATAA